MCSTSSKVAALGFAVGLWCLPAGAASSAWVEAEGGRVRLVTSGTPDSAGHLRGALEIALKPGWKTYWRDPGEAGVPPMIEIGTSSNVSAAILDFPVPERHFDGDFAWAGYGRSVSLPVTFTIATPDEPAHIAAAVFLGVCETICVPVQAELSLDPGTDSPQDAAIVSNAFDALPQPATPDFGIGFVEADAETLVVEALAPGDGAVEDLFIAGSDGYAFGQPEAFETDGRRYFRIPLTRPETRPEGAGLAYTLVTRAGAVSGHLPYF